MSDPSLWLSVALGVSLALLVVAWVWVLHLLAEVERLREEKRALVAIVTGALGKFSDSES